MSIEVLFYFILKVLIVGIAVLLIVNIVAIGIAATRLVQKHSSKGQSAAFTTHLVAMGFVIFVMAAGVIQYFDAQLDRKDTLQRLRGISEDLDEKIGTAVSSQRVSFLFTRQIEKLANVECLAGIKAGVKVALSEPCKLAMSTELSDLPRNRPAAVTR